MLNVRRLILCVYLCTCFLLCIFLSFLCTLLFLFLVFLVHGLAPSFGVIVVVPGLPGPSVAMMSLFWFVVVSPFVARSRRVSNVSYVCFLRFP